MERLITLLAAMLMAAFVLSSCAGSPARSEGQATDTGSGTDFAGLVDIGGDRQIYLECRGSGSPTVVLISGTQGAGDDWTHVLAPDGPQPSTSAVFEQAATFTRVCIYDRPGTSHFGDEPNFSTPVTQPTTAEDGVADLAALLTAAEEPGPYVLVGASWGGLIAQLYARLYPDDVAGLVFVDAASEFLQETLTATQWTNWMQVISASLSGTGVEVPDYEPSIQAVLDAGAVPDVPVVVLTSDQPWDLQVGDGSTWPAWLAAQERLAAALVATHVSQTGSGHAINVEQPQLVVDAIREVVDTTRGLNRETSPLTLVSRRSGEHDGFRWESAPMYSKGTSPLKNASTAIPEKTRRSRIMTWAQQSTTPAR